MSQSSMAMRLRSTGECVDLALLWFREDLGLFMRVGALSWLVSLGLTGLAWWQSPWLGLGVAVLTGSLAQAPLVAVGATRAAGQAPEMTQLQALKKTFLLARSTLVWSALLGVSFLIFPVGLWFLIQTTFLPEVILVEQNTGLLQPIRRVNDLGSRVAGRTLAARLWQGMIVLWGGLAGEFIGQAVIRDLFQSGEPFGSLLGGEVTPFLVLGVWLTQPLWALVRFVMYLDIRTRSESLDVFFSLWMAAGRPRE